VGTICNHDVKIKICT